MSGNSQLISPLTMYGKGSLDPPLLGVAKMIQLSCLLCFDVVFCVFFNNASLIISPDLNARHPSYCVSRIGIISAEVVTL